MRIMLMAALLVGGCAAAGRLGTGSWRAADVNGAPLVAGSNLTLELGPENRVSGSSGCNRYSGTYSFSSRERIRFSALSSTRMACAPDIMQQEQSFLAILGNLESYSLYGDGSLSLIATDGRAVRFRRN